MLNGAAVVTDESVFLKEDLHEKENVIFYSLKNYKDLPEQVQQLLSNSKERKRICENGYNHAKSCHTWEIRAKELLAFLLKE